MGIKRIYLLCVSSLLISCDKGYEIRFTNFYTEPLDSVVIGTNNIVFTAIEMKTSTEFKPINSGEFSVNCITKSKKRFGTQISIPSKGSGKRSLQVDGLQTFVLLEE